LWFWSILIFSLEWRHWRIGTSFLTIHITQWRREKGHTKKDWRCILHFCSHDCTLPSRESIIHCKRISCFKM